ncbi:MAG: AmmeMemoRadiSam system protein A [Nitrospiraceae bacterium]|nr:MAG: AmmeMemoRadiSam system protein A [Nitrospiraceae bacterium]
MHPLVNLAKETIEQYILTGKTITPPDNPSPDMAGKAGVFVCIKIKGELRGCIGTFSPCTESIACEIIHNAISAATCDPRFPPVAKKELSELEYSVDVLTEPEKVSGKEDLDPKKYGVLVKSGERRGLLLPDLEGIDSVDEQISIASMKAGSYIGEPVELYRFEVKRYK